MYNDEEKSLKSKYIAQTYEKNKSYNLNLNLLYEL